MGNAKSNLEDLIKSHHPAAIQERLAGDHQVSYLRDFIYGAIDGIVTTFAIVSGVAGAGLESSIVIILGIANLLGDGFSMAASNYLGILAEQQMQQRIRRHEQTHIAQYPEGEREEIRQIFRAKGFEGEDLERVVDVITADENQWVETMLTEEHGLALSSANPLRAAGTTFAAFVIVGFLPLLAFVLQWLAPGVIEFPYLWSTLITTATFFAVGAAKSWFVEQPWYREGFVTMIVGSAAAGLAYLVGMWLGGLVEG